MLLTMDPSERANRLGFNACLRRVGDYGFRAAVTRAVLEIIMAATVLAVDAPRWTLIGIAVAMLGTYLSLSDNYFTEHGGEPREPLARATFRYAFSGIGKPKPYISGLIEALAYVPLAATGSWGMIGYPAEARLICVACAVGFIASCLGAIFVDAAFYNPEVQWPGYVEFVRATVGFIAAGLAAAVVLTAPWDSRLSWWIAAGLCASLTLAQLRIRETDRAFAAAGGFSDNEQLVGRKAITRHLHSMVGTPLEAMDATMTKYRRVDPDLYDSYRSVVGGYRELLGMDEAADLDVDWPGLLASHLRALGGRYGTLFGFTHPQEPMSRADRVLAHLVLDDMATNAARAEATRCDIDLARVDGHYRATAIDNGKPIDEGRWLREGGGLARLDTELRRLGGGITHATLPDGRKQVTAQWIREDASAVAQP